MPDGPAIHGPVLPPMPADVLVRNACSFLYGAAAKAAFALGYRRIGTYTLPNEGGASLRASSWHLIGARGGGSWSVPSRPRVDKAPTGVKLLWEAAE